MSSCAGDAAAGQPADGLRAADRVLARPLDVRPGGGHRGCGRVPPPGRGWCAACQPVAATRLWRINSATLVADARHSWLDALSSAGALAGLAAVAAGQPWGTRSRAGDHGGHLPRRL